MSHLCGFRSGSGARILLHVWITQLLADYNMQTTFLYWSKPDLRRLIVKFSTLILRIHMRFVSKTICRQLLMKQRKATVGLRILKEKCRFT